jgi:hypothetical protein
MVGSVARQLATSSPSAKGIGLGFSDKELEPPALDDVDVLELEGGGLAPAERAAEADEEERAVAPAERRVWRAADEVRQPVAEDGRRLPLFHAFVSGDAGHDAGDHRVLDVEGEAHEPATIAERWNWMVATLMGLLPGTRPISSAAPAALSDTQRLASVLEWASIALGRRRRDWRGQPKATSPR